MKIKRVLRVGKNSKNKHLVELQEWENGVFCVEASTENTELTAIRYTYIEALERYLIEFSEGCYDSEQIFSGEEENEGDATRT